MVKFTEVIETSFEWTVTQLFRPFRPKKWIILAFCALLAGTLGYQSLNINLPGDTGERHAEVGEDTGTEAQMEAAGAAPAQQKSPDDEFARMKETIREFKAKPYALPLVIVVSAFILALVIFMNWLFSRFSFVFTYSVLSHVIFPKISY